MPGGRPGRATFRLRALPRAPLALDRSVPRRAHQGGHRRPGPAGPVLRGRGQRRRVPHRRLRPHLDAHLRRPANRLHRRARGGAVQPRRHLCGQRRGPAASRPLDRRRHLQVRRRRPHLAPPGAARCAADSADRRGSARCEPAVRRRARTSVRSQRAARHLPLAGRRRDVREGPLQGPGHRRRRRRRRSIRSAHRLCSAVGGAAGALGERRVPGPGQRALQVHRRRLHLAADRQRPSHLRARRPGSHRHRHRAFESAAAVRDRLDEARRHAVPLRRRGRNLVARDRRRAGRRARRRLRRGEGPPAQSRRGLHRQRGHLEVHRRRAHLRRAARRSGRGRLPPHLDRSGEPRGDAPRRRSGCGRDGQRRPYLELLVQPAHRADVPRHRGRRVSLPCLRRPAGERLGLRLEPRTGRRDHLPRLAPRRGRGVRLRRARPARSRNRVRRQADPLRPPDRPGARRLAGGGEADGLPYRAHAAGPLLAARPGHPVLRLEHAVEDGGRWPTLDDDEPRPDPQELGGAGERRQVSWQRRGEALSARGHLRGRALAARARNDLGRDGRRAHPPHARRRKIVARRHAAGLAAVGEGVGAGGGPFRSAHCLRGDQHAPVGRSAAARPADA